MTYNLYLGADVSPITDVAEGRGGHFLEAAAAAYEQAARSDFVARSAAIARTVRRERPAVIAVNEVASWALDADGAPLIGDYLATLLDALSREGLEYWVACETRGAGLRIPYVGAAANGGSGLVSFRNRDAILVDAAAEGLVAHSPQTGDFEAQRVFEVDGHVLDFNRGWASIRLNYRGSALRFMATHLEVAPNTPNGSDRPAIQYAQAEEILRVVADGGPQDAVVLAGDLNTDADSPAGSPSGATYALLTDEFFTDTWVAAGKRRGGPTCCQAPDLANAESRLRSRIDLILTRGPVAAVSAKRVGTRRFRSVPAPLWASDHAGYVARLRF